MEQQGFQQVPFLQVTSQVKGMLFWVIKVISYKVSRLFREPGTTFN
jgi:hypothetical protein